MKPSVYIETTIPSYLTARASQNPVFSGNRQLTIDWWAQRRDDFDLFVSQLVLDEAAEGDAEAATRRLDVIRHLPVLDANESCRSLARSLMIAMSLPARAARDSLHLAVATTNGMTYLLTWNCAHLANAALRTRIESTCEHFGVAAPIICTPQELMQEHYDVD